MNRMLLKQKWQTSRWRAAWECLRWRPVVFNCRLHATDKRHGLEIQEGVVATRCALSAATEPGILPTGVIVGQMTPVNVWTGEPYPVPADQPEGEA